MLYNGLVDIGYGHFCVDHGKNEFVRGKNHVNGIEGFWGLAKVRLTKFKGLPKHTFHLHLKETEWRFNNRSFNIYKFLLKLLRNQPIS
ncbi:MAG: transposase [Alphaproteobacteria bacterium]|nr:transposase [Alphaproteobacteria bacterium]